MSPSWREAGSAAEPDARLWGGRRWTGIGAAVFLAIVLVFALIALLAKGHSAQPASQPAGQPGTSSGPMSTSSTAGEQAGTVTGALLTAAPGGVSWRLVDGVALPFSAAGGPRSVAGGVASGFAHSPAGALLACVQTAFRIGAVDPAAQAGVVRAMVVGAGKAGLLASRPATVVAVKPQLAGFRYLSYSSDRAVIELAERVTDVTDGTARFVDVGGLELAWTDGDWRLVDDGSPAPPPTGLDAGLTGFVAFGGA
jgi:hypothetical protein